MQENTHSLPFIIESCVETVEQARDAEANGADQLELCASLELDGLTPGDQLISNVLQTVNIPVKVMIRHRPGDFQYGVDDVELLLRDLHRVSAFDVAGVVFGAVRGEELDYDLISRFTNATSLPVTIHKAIDVVEDPVEAVQRLVQISGIDSVLTSGGAQTAIEGATVLREMVETAADQLQIIAAGKITVANRGKVFELTSAPVLHGKRIAGWSDIQHR